VSFRSSLRPSAVLALAAVQSFPLAAQGPTWSDIQDRRLSNGFRVILAERPAGGAVHARLFVRLPADAPGALAELTARTLFGPCGPADLGEADADLEAMLAREEGLHEEVRLARLKAGRGAGTPTTELEGLWQESLEALRRRLPPEGAFDRLAGLGATRRAVQARADHLVYGLDLPSAALEAWSGVETARLRALRLPRLPLVRESLRSSATATPQDPALAAFYAVAFPGHPYGRAASRSAWSLDGVGLEEARAFARRTLQPESMVLVLVGDLGGERVLPLLEQSFGTLPHDPRPLPAEGPGEAPAAGARRLQITQPGPPRLLMGWRLPPRSHPDYLGLRVLAKLMAGGPSARLRWTPLEERGVLASLQVSLGEPGARDGGLLVLEAGLGEGHSLGEAEQALRSELLRVQQEPLQEEEVVGAQRLLILESLAQQEDAAAFAQALGEAWSEAGHWQAALADAARLKPWGSEELRRLARTYLASERGVVAFVEPDVLTSDDDPLDVRLVEALKAMARRRLDDPAAVDSLVRQTVRQLRMLPRQERERALELLLKPQGRP
jgi:zinc protease